MATAWYGQDSKLVSLDEPDEVELPSGPPQSRSLQEQRSVASWPASSFAESSRSLSSAHRFLAGAPGDHASEECLDYDQNVLGTIRGPCLCSCDKQRRQHDDREPVHHMGVVPSIVVKPPSEDDYSDFGHSHGPVDWLGSVQLLLQRQNEELVRLLTIVTGAPGMQTYQDIGTGSKDLFRNTSNDGSNFGTSLTGTSGYGEAMKSAWTASSLDLEQLPEEKVKDEEQGEQKEEDEVELTPKTKFRRLSKSSMSDEDLDRRSNAVNFGIKFTENSEEIDYQPGCFRRRVAWLVSTNQFEFAMAVLIISNSLLIGFEAEWSSRNRGTPKPVTFFITGLAYNFLFFVELMLRLTAFGKTFFTDVEMRKWNLLDLFIVLGSLAEAVVDVLSLVQGDGGGDPAHISNVRIIRVVRIARLARTVRVARVVRFVGALRTLVFSIFVTLKALVWAMILLVMIMYFFAILFTDAVSDHLSVLEEDDVRTISGDEVALKSFWPSLTVSILTLFKSIAGGISWHEVVEPLEAVSPLWQAGFYFYIGFVYFAVLNVVTGVFCNSAIDTARNDPDIQSLVIREAKTKCVNQIKNLFRHIDTDGSGKITIQEFENRLKDDMVQAYFASLTLEVQDAWMLFKLLDTGKDHSIDIDEFVDGCLRLRGHAKGVDMAKIMLDNKSILKKLSALGENIRASRGWTLGPKYNEKMSAGGTPLPFEPKFVQPGRLPQSHNVPFEKELRVPPGSFFDQRVVSPSTQFLPKPPRLVRELSV